MSPTFKMKGASSEAQNDRTKKVYQREKIAFELSLAKPDWTPKQKELIEHIKKPETKYVFVKGASGSSKTFTALAVALDLLNSGRIKEIILVRSICESGEISMGSLPGESDEKLAPFMAPFMEKLMELLPARDIKKLQDDKRLIYLPVNYMRGRQFNASFVIIDETQNLNAHEIQTCLTRLGRYSKMLLIGDTSQVDYIKGRKLESGFAHLFDWYNKPEALAQGVVTFKFGIEDIMRDPVIGYIVTEYDAFREHISSGDYMPGKNKRI